MSDYIRKTQERTLTGETSQGSQGRSTGEDGEYVNQVVKSVTKGMVRVIGKKRVYVEDYSSVPDGASLEEGPKGGLYYETEDVEDFAEEQRDRTNAIMEEHDFSQEQINQAQALRDEYDERSDEIFGEIMNTAVETGADLAGGTYRVKGLGSMLRKAHKRDDKDYDGVDDLTDVVRCMVKPETSEGINDTAESLKEVYGEENIIKEENYMEEPQGGYYRARHLVIETEDGLNAEIQIKSPDLSEVASIGHSLVYKNEEAEEAPDVDADTQEEVRDCLTQLSGVIVGQQAEDPDCTREATSLINEMAEKVQVA